MQLSQVVSLHRGQEFIGKANLEQVSHLVQCTGDCSSDWPTIATMIGWIQADFWPFFGLFFDDFSHFRKMGYSPNMLSRNGRIHTCLWNFIPPAIFHWKKKRT
jgi:hypothetical protein